MSCKCQICGKQYKVDVLVSNDLWIKIKPNNKKISSGLICGSCIFKRIEKLGEYNCFDLIKKE